jgi:hypothetical protein
MSPQSTEEQVRERMEAAGIDPSKWGEMGGHDPRQPQFVLRLAGNLTKLNAALEAAVGEKQGEVRLLEEKLARLQYGGGS